MSNSHPKDPTLIEMKLIVIMAAHAEFDQDCMLHINQLSQTLAETCAVAM